MEASLQVKTITFNTCLNMDPVGINQTTDNSSPLVVLPEQMDMHHRAARTSNKTSFQM